MSMWRKIIFHKKYSNFFYFFKKSLKHFKCLKKKFSPLPQLKKLLKIINLLVFKKQGAGKCSPRISKVQKFIYSYTLIASRVKSK